MGHLKLTPPKNVLSPKFTGRLKAEVEAVGPPGAEDIALAKIAQRFAPGQSVLAADDRRFDHKAPPNFVLTSLLGLRALVAALIVVALVPSLILAGMFWLRVIDTPWSALVTLRHNESAPQLVQTASLIGGRPAGNQLKQAAEIPPVSLTAPIILDAKAGEEMPLAIGIISAGALPMRSIIAISGLPYGSALSSGRPYGEREWNLKSDEIGDLRLVLPNDASGEIKLRIDLITPDGESLANAETLLKVTAEADASVVARPRDNERPPKFEVSDFSGVRAYFASASQDGSNDAPLAFGASFDPFLLCGAAPMQSIRNRVRGKTGPIRTKWLTHAARLQSLGMIRSPRRLAMSLRNRRSAPPHQPRLTLHIRGSNFRSSSTSGKAPHRRRELSA